MPLRFKSATTKTKRSATWNSAQGFLVLPSGRGIGGAGTRRIDPLRTKLLITTAAALLAGSLYATAQTQPAGQPPEAPPQGEDAGMAPGSRVQPGAPKQGQSQTRPSSGAVGQGQRLNEGQTPQPGGDPSA
jgi:hypothetical protein